MVSILRHRPLTDLVDFELTDNPGVRLRATDSLMVRRLYWYGEGGYEGAELNWWRFFCARSSHIVEMGANVGFYTVQAGLAAPNARIIAVEAHPESAEATRQNLALNGVSNVDVVEAAVVGRVDTPTIDLYLPDAEQYAAPTGAFVGGAEVAGRPAGRTVSVQTRAASDLVAGADLLKLDIEGFEADVLGAAEREIARERPVIFLEVIRSATRLRALIAEWHTQHKYAVFAIGERSLHLITSEQLHSSHPLPRYGTRDVILLPEEVVSSV